MHQQQQTTKKNKNRWAETNSILCCYIENCCSLSLYSFGIWWRIYERNFELILKCDATNTYAFMLISYKKYITRYTHTFSKWFICLFLCLFVFRRRLFHSHEEMEKGTALNINTHQKFNTSIGKTCLNTRVELNFINHDNMGESQQQYNNSRREKKTYTHIQKPMKNTQWIWI